MRWAETRQNLTAKSHGRLPRAIGTDWANFAKLERELLKDLKEHYIENQSVPPSPAAWIEQQRTTTTK